MKLFLLPIIAVFQYYCGRASDEAGAEMGLRSGVRQSRGRGQRLAM